MFSAVSRSISSAFSSATASWWATARRSSSSTSPNGRARSTTSTPRGSSPASTDAASSATSPPEMRTDALPGARPAPAQQVLSTSAAGGAAGVGVGRVGGGEHEAPALGVELADQAALGAEQPAHAGGRPSGRGPRAGSRAAICWLSPESIVSVATRWRASS